MMKLQNPGILHSMQQEKFSYANLIRQQQMQIMKLILTRPQSHNASFISIFILPYFFD